MNNDSKTNYWRISLIILVVALGALIVRESLPFLGGLLGACTIYVLVRNHMLYLHEKKRIHKTVAAIIILAETILCFLIPAFLAIWLLTDRISNITLEPTSLIENIKTIILSIHDRIGYDVLSNENMTILTSKATSIAQTIISQVSSFLINSVVMLFVLYFMLLGGRKMEKYIYELLPFSPKNRKEVVHSTRLLISSNAIGVPLLAVIQGFIAMIGYIIFGAPDPVVFGFLTCFATIIPLIGTALIWFPLALYLFLSGDVINGVGLAIYALVVISNVDNVIRFMLQKRLADTHPLITIFGVIIGLTLFGFWGVIFGPLLLSIFLLCLDIYKRDYLGTSETKEEQRKPLPIRSKENKVKLPDKS